MGTNLFTWNPKRLHGAVLLSFYIWLRQLPPRRQSRSLNPNQNLESESRKQRSSRGILRPLLTLCLAICLCSFICYVTVMFCYVTLPEVTFISGSCWNWSFVWQFMLTTDHKRILDLLEIDIGRTDKTTTSKHLRPPWLLQHRPTMLHLGPSPAVSHSSMVQPRMKRRRMHASNGQRNKLPRSDGGWTRLLISMVLAGWSAALVHVVLGMKILQLGMTSFKLVPNVRVLQQPLQQTG